MGKQQLLSCGDFTLNLLDQGSRACLRGRSTLIRAGTGWWLSLPSLLAPWQEQHWRGHTLPGSWVGANLLLHTNPGTSQQKGYSFFQRFHLHSGDRILWSSAILGGWGGGEGESRGFWNFLRANLLCHDLSFIHSPRTYTSENHKTENTTWVLRTWAFHVEDQNPKEQEESRKRKSIQGDTGHWLPCDIWNKLSSKVKTRNKQQHIRTRRKKLCCAGGPQKPRRTWWTSLSRELTTYVTTRSFSGTENYIRQWEERRGTVGKVEEGLGTNRWMR